jgi:predicted GH43/DUF377 family glycosyl hydrolase
MHWRKLGLVYASDGSRPWARSHAMVPTPLVRGDAIRLYVAMCDENTVGRIGYVDVDARDPRRVLRVSARPVLDVGEPGCFDDNGVNPLTVLQVGDDLWMYYVGYQLSDKIRYFLFTGLAVSRDGGETFHRHQRVPVLDRSDREAFVRTATWVLPAEGGYQAWYLASGRYVMVGDRLRPTYDIRHITSVDGIHWPEEGQVVLPLTDPMVFGYGRPCVRQWGGGLEMWYSVRWRDRGYRLGFARSPDGLTWTRHDDEVGLDVSAEGWDSEMVCYGVVVPTRFGTYLFYNGNDYGRTGFGVAALA